MKALIRRTSQAPIFTFLFYCFLNKGRLETLTESPADHH